MGFGGHPHCCGPQPRMRRDTTPSSRSHGPRGGENQADQHLRPHLFACGDLPRGKRARSPWALASARPQSWPVGEGVSVRLSPRAEDLCQPQWNLWHLDQIHLSGHSYHPMLAEPPFCPKPCADWPARVDGTLTMGVLYLWLTTSLISGTKTGQARNKTESSKLRAVPSSPRRRRPAQGPSLRAAPRAAAQAVSASVQPLQEERTRPQTLP